MRQPARSTITTIITATLAGLIAAAACTGVAAALPKKYSPYHKLGIFSRVLTYVENNYVEDVDQDKLVYGAIRGMLETLDPHSNFLDPDQYREMKSETSGRFDGVGIEVEVRDGALTILSAIDGTPAARAGLATGDVILKIEDRPTKGITIDEAVARMRGKRGAALKLTIGRRSWPEPRTFNLMRDSIKVENVTGRNLEAGYAYAKIRQFADNTDHDLASLLDRLEQDSPGGKLRGLILDLRNNPGGLLDQAVRVADEFIEDGLIVRTEGRGGRVLDEDRAHQRGTRLGFPIICLVNGGSASASEIVAGALQDHGRAVILGTQTFGKGSVQTVIEMDDGSALKLTVARYFTPKGRSIQEQGITPDVVVEKFHLADLKPDRTDEPEKKERDLAGHLRNPQATGQAAVTGAMAPGIDDFQLHTALDYLKAWNILAVTQMKSHSRQVAGR
ncbi:MAG TPA: S41 family peptidase [Polyangia bacterium]|jgi:carboxyl-terminal processing protease|nr:S41 family peptidase [Polyangia bacterium]